MVDSLWQANPFVDLMVIGSKIPGLKCVPTKDDDEASAVLVNLIKRGEIDGFIRGKIKDSYTHKLFVQELGGTEKKKPCAEIIAKEEQWFFLIGPSAYNSLDYASKKYEVLAGLEFVKK